MNLTPEQKRARLEALTKLAIATREKLERETIGVYLDALQGWSTAIFVEACRRLQSASQWFPKVAEIADACRTVEREQQIRKEQRQLKAPDDQISPERWQQLLADIRRVCNRHDLNADRRSE